MKKLIIIGLGLFGKGWIETALKSSEWQVAGIVDSNSDVLKENCRQFGISEKISFTNVDEAFDNIKANAVIVAVPPKFHKGIVEKAISYNLHVLKEKPLADSLDEAKSLVKLAQKNENLVFMVSQNYRWRPGPQTIKKAIGEGLLGEIGYINYEFQRFSPINNEGWRAKESEILLKDMSIHHFDLLRFITGKNCQRVYAYSYSPRWSVTRNKTVASVLLTFEDDIGVNYFGSFDPVGYETGGNGNIIFVGNKGSIIYKDENITYIPAGGKAENLFPQEMKYINRDYSLHAFSLAIDTRHGPETDFDDNLKSFVISCAAINSSKMGKEIGVKELLK